MKRRYLVLAIGLALAGILEAQTPIDGQSGANTARWKYKVINHSQYLREG